MSALDDTQVTASILRGCSKPSWQSGVRGAGGPMPGRPALARVPIGHFHGLVWLIRSSLVIEGTIDTDPLIWFEQESESLSFQKASE